MTWERNTRCLSTVVLYGDIVCVCEREREKNIDCTMLLNIYDLI